MDVEINKIEARFLISVLNEKVLSGDETIKILRKDSRKIIYKCLLEQKEMASSLITKFLNRKW